MPDDRVAWHLVRRAPQKALGRKGRARRLDLERPEFRSDLGQLGDCFKLLHVDRAGSGPRRFPGHGRKKLSAIRAEAQLVYSVRYADAWGSQQAELDFLCSIRGFADENSGTLARIALTRKRISAHLCTKRIYVGEYTAMFLVRLLGGVEIETDGISRPYGARKYAALLALLALNPRRIFSRSEIVAAIWPDNDDESGRAALRTALSTLRQELSADSLVTTRATVCLAQDHVTTDVALLEEGVRRLNQSETAGETADIFQQLQKLYRGPLLPDRYEDWIVAERARIDEMMRGAQTRFEILHRTLEKEWPPERTTPPAPSRLPSFATRFLGRDVETDAVCGLLDERAIRLVTITGTGGIGKTRFAVEIARRLHSAFSGAVFFIPLAACADGNEILTELGRALFTENNSSNEWESVVARQLRAQGRLLVILDNLEHLVDRGAALAVRRLLDVSPLISVLATSRHVLGIEGERVFPLQGLKNTTDQSLFVEHAQCLQPEFGVTDANRVAVERLCEQLEGIPLAIELCAAWIPVLTPQQILGKLTDRFSLLKSRRHDASARHRSLHAALEWGCPTEEGVLAFFLALSVFRGGFSLEAAQAVGGDDALDRLATLREQSLIVAEAQDNGTMRYRLLETIREFADEKLSGEERLRLQRRHRAYYSDLAGSITPRLSGTDTAVHFAALEQENPNFRAAIERGLDDTIDGVLQARLMIIWLNWFWRMRGHQMPLRSWLEKIYAHLAELPAVDQAWIMIDYADYVGGDHAISLCKDALSLFEANEIPFGTSQAYMTLGHIYRGTGDLNNLVDCFTKAAAIRAGIGDVRGEGYALAELAGSYFEFGDGNNARLLWERCRDISVALSDIGSLAVLDRAEAVSLLQDDRPRDALPLFERAVATFRLKGETWNLMDTLEKYGNTLATTGVRDIAVEVLTEAALLAERWGDSARAANVRREISELNSTVAKVASPMRDSSSA